MNRWKAVRAAAILSIMIPVLIVIICEKSLGLDLLLVGWIAAAVCLSEWSIRKAYAFELQKRVQVEQLRAIRTVNHYRHDWMNELQVIYGYVQMKKLDNLMQSMGRISERMIQESKISKLGVPSLVMFLQSFRTISNDIQLEVQIKDELNLAEMPLAVDTEVLSGAIQETVLLYCHYSKRSLGEVSQLRIVFEPINDDLSVLFQFDGDIQSIQEMRSKMNSVVHGKTIVAEQQHGEQASFRLHVPCGT